MPVLSRELSSDLKHMGAEITRSDHVRILAESFIYEILFILVEKPQVLDDFMAGLVYTIYTLTERAVGNLEACRPSQPL